MKQLSLFRRSYPEMRGLGLGISLRMRQAMWRPIQTNFKRGVVSTLNLVLPPHSLLTRDLKRGKTDRELWTHIQFLDEPCCDVCGFPFEFDMGKGALCAACIGHPPKNTQIRSALAYDEASRQMVLDFKHGGQTAGVSFFGLQMARAGRGFLNKADFIVPVPLHYKRLVKRRYNQSALLGRAVGKRSKANFNADILERHKATDTQGGRTAAGRRRNVQGAFRVRPKAALLVKGAHIVLVDDVYTTGATLEACAKTLLRAGARRVDSLTLARVVRGTALPT